MKKPINERVLESCLRLLTLMESQLELVDRMRKAIEARIITLQEFIRANATGDQVAFDHLKSGFKEAGMRGSTQRFYDHSAYDHVRTRMIVRDVREKYPVTVDQSTVEQS